MKQIKVLHLMNSLNYGGAERFLLNLYQNIDKEKIQFDIMVRSTSNPMAKEFEELGAKIIIAPNFPKNISEHSRFLEKFVRDNASNYKFVHVHANSLIYTLPFKIFKNKQIADPQIILHSHNSQSTSPIVTAIHKFNRKWMLKNVDVKIACSDLAGKWMFNDEDYQIVYNGIDIEKFTFNEKVKNAIRQELGVADNEILLGSVGRFVKAKNFDFLLKIFKDLEESSTNPYKLVLVGTGELEAQLKELVEKYQIQDKVIFTGQRNDINQLLSAMDIYLQPSLYEGFPFTVVEAQAANLPVLMSDNITAEVKFSSRLKSISVENSSTWVDEIIKMSDVTFNRKDYTGMDTAKVDIKNIAKTFEEIYTNVAQ